MKPRRNPESAVILKAILDQIRDSIRESHDLNHPVILEREKGEQLSHFEYRCEKEAKGVVVHYIRDDLGGESFAQAFDPPNDVTIIKAKFWPSDVHLRRLHLRVRQYYRILTGEDPVP